MQLSTPSRFLTVSSCVLDALERGVGLDPACLEDLETISHRPGTKIAISASEEGYLWLGFAF
jgi:hypothetical protein